MMTGLKLTGNHWIGTSVSLYTGRSCQCDILSVNERRIDCRSSSGYWKVG
jgi:hypothetical protein